MYSAASKFRSSKCCSYLIECWCFPLKICSRAIRLTLAVYSQIVKPAFLLIGLILLLLWGEWYVYHQKEDDWRNQIDLHNEHNPSNRSFRILLVGDPQLVGDVNEPRFVYPLTQLDSDRFLRNTFSRAIAIAKPHVVIFMGDLFDEGGIASNESIVRYGRRFESIFNTRHNRLIDNKPEFVAIWGDNDLENSDFLSASKHDDYRQRAFLIGQSLGLDVLNLAQCRQLLDGRLVLRHFDAILTDPGNVHDQGCTDESHFKPAKIFMDSISKMKATGQVGFPEIRYKADQKPIFKILVSHEPLIGPYAMELGQAGFAAVRNFAPNLVIAGHLHSTHVTWCENCLNKGDDPFIPVSGQRDVQEGDKPYLVPLPRPGQNDAAQPHVLVPTSSYRMGYAETGYGIITMNIDSFKFTFSTLWNPHRYLILGCYIIWLILAAIRLLCWVWQYFEQSDYFYSFMKQRRTHKL